MEIFSPAISESLHKRLWSFFDPEPASPAAFESVALDLFRFQYFANEAYRALCNARGIDPETIEQWSEIVAVTTSGFKDFDFSCLPPNDRTHVFYSSGTTEQRPSRHFHGEASLQLYEASLLTGFERCNPSAKRAEQPGSQTSARNRAPITILALTPPPRAARHCSLAHMFATIGRIFDSTFLGTIAPDSSWTLDFDRTRSKLAEACSKSTPAFILGTAFLFVHLLDWLAAAGVRFQLPPGSMVLETGGYKGRSRVIPRTELHSLICDRLGLAPHQILSEYGMCELSSQAYARLSPGASCDYPCVFHFPPWARAQVISPETGLEVRDGEAGVLRVLDLANAWSVCAIQTEDLAIKRGAGFELLGRAQTAEPRGCSIMARAEPFTLNSFRGPS